MVCGKMLGKKVVNDLSVLKLVRTFTILNFFSALCILPSTSFAELGTDPFEGLISLLSTHEQEGKDISFETRIPIYVDCSYPIFSEKSTLVEWVNRQLKTEAENHFACFVQGEVFTEEIWEDECTLSYQLFPVYQTPNLISVYGCDFQGRGCHGCTYYEGITYWQRGNSVVKLVLDDLFIKGSNYRQFLLRYCENQFKISGYGYYSSRSELLPILSPNDLDTFVLTNKGLVIVFRAYTVGGWADGPDMVLIPYAKLGEFIDPLGPLEEAYNCVLNEELNFY